MGTSTSSLSFNLSQYQYLQETIDPRFGDIKIYQKNETGELICVIEKIFNQPTKPFKKLDHPNLLKVYYYQANTYKEVCSTFTKLFIVYEYINNDLKTIIENRQKKNQYFTIKQLWAFLYQSLDVLNYLKSHDIYPMDMKNLYISNLGQIKLNSLFDNHMTSLQQIINQVTDNYHISPEELQILKHKQYIIELNQEKCEIFQLGLTLLWMASLNDTSTLFNKIENRLNEQDLNLRISELKYSEQFKNILQKMLNNNPNERGSFEYLLQTISINEREDNLFKIEQNQEQILSVNNTNIKSIQQKNIDNQFDEYEYQSQTSYYASNRKLQQGIQQNKIQNFYKQISLIGSITVKNENQEINNNNQQLLTKLLEQNDDIFENQQQQQQQSKSRSFLQIKSPEQSPISSYRKPPSISASKNQLHTTSKPLIPIIPKQLKFNKEKNLETSYFSSQSLLSNNKSNKSILENRIEEAIAKSKIALAKFDQTIKQNNYYQNQ